jgi:hypothetical protein
MGIANERVSRCHGVLLHEAGKGFIPPEWNLKRGHGYWVDCGGLNWSTDAYEYYFEERMGLLIALVSLRVSRGVYICHTFLW